MKRRIWIRYIVGTLVCGIVAFVLFVTGVVLWGYRPWIPENQENLATSKVIDGKKYEIWQIQGGGWGGFFTQLYVESGPDQWDFYYLDHEDFYSPGYEIEKKNGSIVVSLGNYEMKLYTDPKRIVIDGHSWLAGTTHGTLRPGPIAEDRNRGTLR